MGDVDLNFHRDLGITLLDAKWLDPKWLDPKCHKGCQSLFFKQERDELRAALKDRNHKIRVLQNANDIYRSNEKLAKAAEGAALTRNRTHKIRL